MAAAASRLALVKNAIDAVKSDTSLVRVPMALPTQGGMVVAEAMVPLAVEARLGAHPHFLSSIRRVLTPFFSYTCGGVGHLSRDCVQGSKCYNCSGIVRDVILVERRIY